MEGHGRSFLDTRFTFKVRKVMGHWFVCRIILSTPLPFLCDLDLGFGTQDLDMGLTVVLSVKFLSEKLFTQNYLPEITLGVRRRLLPVLHISLDGVRRLWRD